MIRPFCKSCIILASILLAFFANPSSANDGYVLIICGSGGEETYSHDFADWGGRLRETLHSKFEYLEERVFLMTEAEDSDTSRTVKATTESISSRLGDIAANIKPTEDLFLFLIGHGSFVDQRTVFNIPGPDLASSELKAFTDPIKARHLVLINGSSSSAGFINDMTGPNRIICTATKSVEENNAPFFMKFLVQALEEGSADTDRDERVSVLEACRQAASFTEAHYQAEGWIQSEHAILDDNADGLGTRILDIDAPKSSATAESSAAQAQPSASDDGQLAATCYLKDFSFPPAVPRALVDRYLSLLDQVQKLKLGKKHRDADAYYAELEALLVEAAKANREIRHIIDGAKIESEGTFDNMP